MTDVQGSFGRTRVFEDFLGGFGDSTRTITGVEAVGDVSLTSINEGSFAYTVDEPGGVISVVTDTADLDTAALFAGVFQPSLGRAIMEVRLKLASITTTPEVVVGFTETLSVTAPALPMTHATTVATYVGAGVGVNFSADSTAATWRAWAGDASVATGTLTVSSVGAPVADEWDIFRVEIGEDGSAEVYHDGVLIKSFAAATLTPTDKFHATIMLENKEAAANTMEVDYFYAAGGRDWNVA